MADRTSATDVTVEREGEAVGRDQTVAGRLDVVGDGDIATSRQRRIAVQSNEPDARCRIAAQRHSPDIDAEVGEAVVAVQHQVTVSHMADRTRATDVTIQREGEAVRSHQTVAQRLDVIGNDQTVDARSKRCVILNDDNANTSGCVGAQRHGAP